MSYLSWFEAHATKHRRIVDKLLDRGLDQEQIISYFSYENLSQNEPDFCPLFQKKEQCHEMESLNCYLCACPHFRFNDQGIDKIEKKDRYSLCSIDSKEGQRFVTEEAIHQDCSGCKVPHYKAFIQKNFDPSWKQTMSDCKI